MLDDKINKSITNLKNYFDKRLEFVITNEDDKNKKFILSVLSIGSIEASNLIPQVFEKNISNTAKLQKDILESPNLNEIINETNIDSISSIKTQCIKTDISSEETNLMPTAIIDTVKDPEETNTILATPIDTVKKIGFFKRLFKKIIKSN
jgi:hypothetical protein